MDIHRRTLVAAGLLAASTTPFAQLRGSAIKLIVPLPPGSGGDNIARILAPKLSEALKQNVIVENKPGADMMLGASHVAKAPADGNTLFMGHLSTMVLNPFAYKAPGYDPLKDFVPVGKISESTAVLVVHPGVPAKTLSEFVDYARANPGRVSYGTAILMVQVAAEQLAHTRRLQMTRVPYKGGAQVMQDTVARHIEMSIADTSSYLALIRAGKLRPLATTGAQRNLLLPEVPTAREAGFPELEITGWWSLFAPARTPTALVAKTSSALQRVLSQPEVIQQLRAIGAEPKPLASEQLKQVMAKEIGYWGDVMRTLKIKGGE